jgi:hypothetical protein
MRTVLYTMHFRGQVSRSTGNPSVLKTTISGTSCTMETAVGRDGATTTLHAAPGELAFIEAELRLSGHEEFEGSGTLAFGEESEHALHFSSAKTGHLSPIGKAGTLAGAIVWKVDGGDGRFAGATGFITSNFTFNETGALSEYQCGQIFIPD